MITLENRLQMYLSGLKQRVNQIDFDIESTSNVEVLEELKRVIEEIQNILDN